MKWIEIINTHSVVTIPHLRNDCPQKRFKRVNYAAMHSDQSHCKKVAQGAIFMEQKMRFGLILGQLAILNKTIWANYEQLLREVFSCFQGQKMFSFFLKNCRVRTKGQLILKCLLGVFNFLQKTSKNNLTF